MPGLFSFGARPAIAIRPKSTLGDRNPTRYDYLVYSLPGLQSRL